VAPTKSADEVTVTGEKPKTFEEILDTAYPGAGSTLPDITDSVTVEARKTPTQDQIDAGELAAKAAADAAAKAAADAATADPAKKEPSTLDKVDDYLTYGKLGLTLLGLLGGAGAGGKGTGATGTVPGGAGVMPPTFKTDTLPTGDDIPAYGGGTNRRPKDVSKIDWDTYGFRPGIKFFENVPKAAKAASPLAALPVAKVPLPPPTLPQIPDSLKRVLAEKEPEFANPPFAYIDDPTDFVTMPADGLIGPPAGGARSAVMDNWVNDKTGESRFDVNFTPAPDSGWRQAFEPPSYTVAPKFYDNASPGEAREYAKGGSMAVKRPSKSFAVRGAGDGRSDDIPAVLSDGEYVMDAETVALLGNGSNKAGAAQLDRFRANVRKHKGKDLAKGRFSANAKNLQAYMAGGRS